MELSKLKRNLIIQKLVEGSFESRSIFDCYIYRDFIVSFVPSAERLYTTRFVDIIVRLYKESENFYWFDHFMREDSVYGGPEEADDNCIVVRILKNQDRDRILLLQTIDNYINHFYENVAKHYSFKGEVDVTEKSFEEINQ